MKQKALTRPDISKRLGNRKYLCTNSKQAKEFINIVIEEIGNALKNGKEVKLPNFGVFFVRSKKERLGRNPKTMVSAPICARYVTCLRYSRKVRDKLNIQIAAKKGKK